MLNCAAQQKCRHALSPGLWHDAEVHDFERCSRPDGREKNAAGITSVDACKLPQARIEYPDAAVSRQNILDGPQSAQLRTVPTVPIRL